MGGWVASAVAVPLPTVSTVYNPLLTNDLKVWSYRIPMSRFISLEAGISSETV